MRTIQPPPLHEAFDFPVTGPAPGAGRFFGMGRDATYAAIKAGDFPCQVLRIGGRYRVTRSALLQALGLTDPGNSLAPAPSPQVSGLGTDA
jgi:predicted DNA-binding transcriptional regulator AlpA